MTTLTRVLAISSTLVVMATSPAFAGPEAAEQYPISRPDVLSPTFPALLNPAGGSHTGLLLLAPGINPHWGPAFDPDVE